MGKLKTRRVSVHLMRLNTPKVPNMRVVVGVSKQKARDMPELWRKSQRQTIIGVLLLLVLAIGMMRPPTRAKD